MLDRFTRLLNLSQEQLAIIRLVRELRKVTHSGIRNFQVAKVFFRKDVTVVMENPK